MEQLKQCKTCLIEKPLDSFIKDKTSKFGRLGYCKVCTSTRKEKEVLEDGLKRCSKCKEIKATSDFIKDLQKADGFRSDCKVCTRIDYYKRNNIEFKEPRIRPEKEDGKKYCPKCDKNVLFSYFNKDISTKSGLESCCKNCKDLYKQTVVRICGVYKILNTNNRIYIGSSLNIKNRWSSYKTCNQTRIKESFEEYGIENHTFEVIEECLEEDLKCRERFWQDYYNVLGENGLNDVLEKCGELNQVLSHRVRERIRQTNTGKKASDATKKKQGMSHTKKCLILQLSTGIFFDSIIEIVRIFGIDRSYLYYNLRYSKNNKTDFIIC